MGLEHYIKDLLYRYNCVIVPGFGAFLTQERSAVIQEGTNTFYPPSKTVSFNGQLVSNDGLLVSYAAEVQKLSFEEMHQLIREEVLEWKSQLQKGEHLELSDIGTLWMGTEDKIQFQPTGSVNYLTSSFGMASFVSVPVTREVLKTEVSELEGKTPITFTPEKREALTVRPYLKYAAVVLLALTAGFSGYKYYKTDQANQQLAREEAQELVSKRIQEATFFDTDPLELPAITLKTSKKAIGPDKTSNKKVHHIIAGAFRYRTNADRKIAQLKEQGYNPSYIGTNSFGLYMVAYDSFTDADKALTALREIKLTQKDAWLKSVK
ncbi:HU domain-containing protein [Pseudozobellia thermophila]|uniref:Sporulation related domain-containing protein n=1 Tax=Pseudozobellia thermophila TaxID=192903 RepID=A0A1M6BR38_9FLAO|nr:SPOR domain-containing protein [Pseudozobellia thermophila]SHI51250.1 Sporulation related domain-containing protein [Pseudozobellia thermophila]